MISLIKYFHFLIFVLLIVGCAPSLESGINAFSQRSYKDAYPIFLKYKENREAQFYLFLLLKGGKEVESDEQTSLEYLKKSAAQNFPDAQEALAEVYMNGTFGVAKDKIAALKLYEAAAANGKKTAYIGISDYYFSISQDKIGFSMLQKAEGTAAGDFRIAYSYESSRGIIESPVMAFKYMQAATQHPTDTANRFRVLHSQVALAEYYLYGYGTNKDEQEAARLLNAIKEESTEASSLFAWLQFWGYGMSAEPGKAVATWTAILNKAITEQKGDARHLFADTFAFYGLASAYSGGGNFPANQEKVKFFTDNFEKLMAGHAGDYLALKLNAKGFLKKRCSAEDPLVAIFGGRPTPGRYRSLKADGFAALSVCLPKDTAEQRITAYYVALDSQEADSSVGGPAVANVAKRMTEQELGMAASRQIRTKTLQRLGESLAGQKF